MVEDGRTVQGQSGTQGGHCHNWDIQEETIDIQEDGTMLEAKIREI